MFIIEETLNAERITDIIMVILNKPNVIICAESSCVDAEDFDNKIHALNS